MQLQRCVYCLLLACVLYRQCQAAVAEKASTSAEDATSTTATPSASQKLVEMNITTVIFELHLPIVSKDINIRKVLRTALGLRFKDLYRSNSTHHFHNTTCNVTDLASGFKITCMFNWSLKKDTKRQRRRDLPKSLVDFLNMNLADEISKQLASLSITNVTPLDLHPLHPIRETNISILTVLNTNTALPTPATTPSLTTSMTSFTGNSAMACTQIRRHCHKDAVCVQLGTSAGCQCKSGYVGDGVYCSASKLCPDRRLLCSVDADCGFSPYTFSHYCSCKSGYAGDGHICSDIDECQENSHRCHVNADCINSIGSYRCECKDGFSGDGFNCKKGFPCLHPNLTCSINAYCGFDAGLGRFHCTCKPGYTGDGSTCTDIDECKTAQNNCDVHAMCTNSLGSYNCKCVDGYIGDGHTCQARGKPCPDYNFTCSENARCVFEEKFQCLCKPGYVGDGQTCQDIDECKEKKDNCDHRAVCTNTDGSFKCSCLFGTLGDGVTCV